MVTKSNEVRDFQFNMQWLDYGDNICPHVKPVVYLDGVDCKPSEKIAAFDIDCTIIKTKSGKNYSQDKFDWTFLYEIVPEKLNALYEEGYKLVFITNQGAVEKDRTNLNDLKYKFCRVIEEIGVPIQVYILTGYNHYRKPNCAIWEIISEKCNGGVSVDLDKSFYCGDAAGRCENWIPGRKRDFSCDDRKFAANIGLSFQTPEEFFLGYSECDNFEWRSFDPNTFLTSSEEKEVPNFENISSHCQELVLLVGRPTSGKSLFIKRYLLRTGYITAVDEKETEKLIMKGHSICIDSTNTTLKDRESYIAIAKVKGIQVRCLYFKTSLKLALHLNIFKQNYSLSKIRFTPMKAYTEFDRMFEVPTVKEGIDSVIEIEFYPQFENRESEKQFKLWTPEA